MRAKVVVGALFLTASAAPSQSLPDTIPAERLGELIRTGNRLFHDGSCGFCHGMAGRGDRDRAPDLTDAEWLHSDGNYEDIRATIFWGVRKDRMKAVAPRPFEMNPMGGMRWDFQQLNAAAAYVWALSRPERSELVAVQARTLAAFRGSGVARAVAAYREAVASDSASAPLTESMINSLGYEHLQQRKDPKSAIVIFRLNTELYPKSWNVWDSLAEGHMLNGEREEAIRLYEKSLQLNPQNENGREKLKELRGS